MPPKVIDLDERRAAADVVDRAIRHLLVDRRMRIPEVAERAGIKLPTLYEKLRGDTVLEWAEVRLIARSFGLSVPEFLRLGDEWAARDSNPEPAGSGLIPTKTVANSTQHGALSDVAA